MIAGRAVGVGVKVGVGVGVTVGVGVGVAVGDGVAEGVNVGSTVTVGVTESVGAGEGAVVGRTVGVFDGAGEGLVVGGEVGLSAVPPSSGEVPGTWSPPAPSGAGEMVSLPTGRRGFTPGMSIRAAMEKTIKMNPFR